VKFSVGKFLSGPFNATTIEGALQKITAPITAIWSAQHKEDGTHGDVTVDTLEVTDPDQEGNVTGSLVPTTATQDLGAVIELSGVARRVRPWRDLTLSGDITWMDYADAIVTGNPIITRNGRSLAVSCGATGVTGSFTVTAHAGLLSNTFSCGAGGVSSEGAVNAGTTLFAGTFAQASQLRLTDGVTAPTAVAGLAILYVDTADGDLKVVFGDGTVKTIVTDT
jgi:hypothetical protein